MVRAGVCDIAQPLCGPQIGAGASTGRRYSIRRSGAEGLRQPTIQRGLVLMAHSPEVETLIAEMEQCLRDGRPSVNADRVRTWLASLRGAAEKPHAITRLKRDTWFDLNAPTDRTWPQGTRELCERAYQDGLAGRGAAEPEQPHPHVCHDRNPPFPGPCPACESERGEAAPVPAPPEKAENQTPADRASERNLA